MTLRAVFAVAIVAAVFSGSADAQPTTYDVKTINFDLWCQEQANLPADRCDQRLPQDEERYEAFRDTIEKYEIPYLQQKQREQQIKTNILEHDPVDNPLDKQLPSSQQTIHQ